MTNKEIFIETIERLFAEAEPNTVPLEAYAYLSTLREETSQTIFTENGYRVFEWMRAHAEEHNNVFTAKVIAAGLDCSSRSVSGALRKLVNDGWVAKTGEKPSCYVLTDAGFEYVLDVAQIDN